MTNETVALQTIDALTEIRDALTAGHPLAALDLAISYLDTHGSQKQQRNALKLLGRAALKHLGLVQESEFSLESLFEPQFPHPAKRFIALCLIRALYQNPDLFIEPVFRNRSFNLFDVTLPDIYKGTKITSKTQTHEKEAALRTYVADVEQQLSEIFRPVDALTPPTWDNLVPLKQNLQRFIKKFGGFLGSVVTRF